MNKIKVYIQYPWKVSDSQYYKSMIENPPRGIEYLPKGQKAGIIVNRRKLAVANFLKGWPRKLLEISRLPLPNSHKTSYEGDYDLIHCAHCLSKENTIKPWVVDLEDAWQMWISGRDTKIGIEKVRKIIKGPNCKKILAWTPSAKEDILKRYPEIEKKVEVVGFGQPIQKFKKSKKNNIRLLFIGRYFRWKGGYHAVEAMDRLIKKYDYVDAVIISRTPKSVLKKYSKNKKIQFFELMPHKEIIGKIFPSSDILIYPGYSDTFGFIFPEALSFGIPVVTVDGFARNDMIKDGKTGKIILLNKKMGSQEMGSIKSIVIDELVLETSKLIENEKLRTKMSENCLEEVEKGVFSIERRNRKLKRIYEEIVKR
ncbi:MAG: glycosyltransferase family 4 protein [archaeon]|nr:glycosyltransferase family 4 protein [archaeon]MCR4323973.1 glycosyltransferase family 4 protein [Nanoarchaeota archaeon]